MGLHVQLEKLTPSEQTREGRMLAAGSITLTLTSLESGRHVTLRLRASARRDGGARLWPTVPFRDATHVFIESYDGMRVATYYPQDGHVWFERDASKAARWTVQAVLRYLAGRFPTLTEVATLDAANLCGRCGRELTDPESIERGFGPECFGVMTTSRHAEMHAA